MKPSESQKIPSGLTPARKLIVAAVLGAGALSLAACTYIAPQETNRIQNVTDGINAEVGQTKLNNMLVVSREKGDSGRLLGQLSNSGANDITVTFSTSDGSRTETKVPANSSVNLTKETSTLSSVSVAPGGLLAVKISTSEGKDLELKLPVLNGTLAEYRPYLPTESESPSVTPEPSTTPMPMPTSDRTNNGVAPSESTSTPSGR